MPEEPQSVVSSPDTREGARSIVSTILIIILAPLIALLITTFVFQSYEVDGDSMETTLRHQDRLIVLKLPRTIASLTRNPYIPKRGDIIIFKREGTVEFGTGQEKQLIKRVVALPGERVVVENGKLIVYNQDNPQGFSPDDNEAYSQVIGFTPGKVNFTVPENEIFAVGDNRSNSLDSRNFGSVPAKDIVGKLMLRILPIGSAQAF